MNMRLKAGTLELNEAYQKMLWWFFSFPDCEMSLSELAHQLQLAKTTTNRVVKRLVREGFLHLKELGRVWRVSCNKSHKYNFSRKIGYHLMAILESGILDRIHEQFPAPPAVILFGSYRKGDDTDKSDLDLAVEVLDDQELRIQEAGVIPQLLFRKNVPIALHIFSRNKINLNVFANIANGIVLEGFLEVRP